MYIFKTFRGPHHEKSRANESSSALNSASGRVPPVEYPHKLHRQSNIKVMSWRGCVRLGIMAMKHSGYYSPVYHGIYK